MEKLPQTKPRCNNCGQIPPLRAAQIEALIEYVQDAHGAELGFNFYAVCRTRFSWTRAMTDRIVSDAAMLGKIRLCAHIWGIEIKLAGAEGEALCPTA